MDTEVVTCKYLFNSIRLFSKNSSLKLLRKLLPGKTKLLNDGIFYDERKLNKYTAFFYSI